MRRYIITSKARHRVAGQPNSGVGTALYLTEERAAAALASGEIIDPEADVPAIPENTPAGDASGNSGGKGRRKREKAPAGEKTGV